MSIRYSLDDFSELTDQIYTAAATPLQWPATLASIAQRTGSSSACLPTMNCAFKDIETDYRVPRELYSEYAADLAALDKLSDVARQTPDFVGVTSEIFKLEPDMRVPAFETRAQHYGLAERWGANLSADVAIGMHRESGMPDYSHEDKRFLGRLVPHLRNAVHIHERLARAQVQRDDLLECIGRLGMGVVLLDDQGQVALTNPRADLIIRDATSLRISQGLIECVNKRENRRLQKILAEVIRNAEPAGCLRLEDCDPQLEVLVCPFRWPNSEEATVLRSMPEYVVFVSESQQCVDMSLDMLRTLYQLTRTEADVLYLLANDFRVNEIADLRQVSLNTVRTHMQTLRAKTRTRCQADLVKLALSSTTRLVKA